MKKKKKNISHSVLCTILFSFDQYDIPQDVLFLDTFQRSLKHLVDRFSHQAEDNKNDYFFLVELYLGCVWDLKKKVNLFYCLAYFCF